MVSVLMPILNYSENITSAIETVINQTYRPWELLIAVNMNMIKYDTFWTALSNLKIFDIKIIRYHYKNRSEALNILCEKSKYDWIAIKGCDDVWEFNKLEQQMYIASGNEYKIIGTKIKYFEPKTYIKTIPTRDITNYNFFNDNPIYDITAIIHKSTMPYWENDWENFEDYELWLRLWKKRFKFYNLDGVYVTILKPLIITYDRLSNLHLQLLLNYHKK